MAGFQLTTRLLSVAFAIALLCSRSVHAQAEIQFYETVITDDSVAINAGPGFVVLNNATAYTCLNLADLMNNARLGQNNQTLEPGRVPNNATIFALDGINYVRYAHDSFDPQVAYTQWYVNQYPWGANSSTAAAMQVNVYAEADCKSDTDSYLAHSCRQSAGGWWPDGSSAMSLSLQPNDVGAGSCLYNATNGDSGLEYSAADAGEENGGSVERVRRVGVVVAALGVGFATMF